MQIASMYRSWVVRLFAMPALMCLPLSLAYAQTPYQSITSNTGPLTGVHIGNEGSTQIAHIRDVGGEFYPATEIPGDAGTFIIMNGMLYSPDFNNHRGSAAPVFIGPRIPFTPVSQTGQLPV